jgi:hypothetical protein
MSIVTSPAQRLSQSGAPKLVKIGNNTRLILLDVRSAMMRYVHACGSLSYVLCQSSSCKQRIQTSSCLSWFSFAISNFSPFWQSERYVTTANELLIDCDRFALWLHNGEVCFSRRMVA